MENLNVTAENINIIGNFLSRRDIPSLTKEELKIDMLLRRLI